MTYVLLLASWTSSLSSGCAQPGTVIVGNYGDSDMEGHTPMSFEGSATGLFTGDELSSDFPVGSGVWAYLSFDLSDLPPGKLDSATLLSTQFEIRGTPFEDLGALVVEEVRYDSFSSALWNLEAQDEHGCTLATQLADTMSCDLTDLVAHALDDDQHYAQLRLHFEAESDADGSQDMLCFFVDGMDVNVNQPGLLELELSTR